MVYSNNLSKPYASGAITNVTQDAKDTRQKYLDAAKYGKSDNKPKEQTEAEKLRVIRDNIYGAAAKLSGKAMIDKLFKLKGVEDNWERVAGNPTMLKRKGSGVIEKIDVSKLKSVEALKAQFEQY
jgi:hypothetical protein